MRPGGQGIVAMRVVGPVVLVLVAFALGQASVGWADEPQWISLFDGKTLEGWAPQFTDRFSVRTDVIFCDGGTGWLRCEKPFKNFEFSAEYRSLKGGADTGIFFRASSKSADKAPNWPTECYQLQVSDSDSHLMFFGHGATVKFDRKADELKSVSKGVGEWQTLKLTVKGSHATAHLNGTLISESDAIRLEGSHIGLQGENGQFEWRELKIRELP